jgi:hypothetical protein
MIRGPQPETVKAYRLEINSPSAQENPDTVLRVTDNHLGKRVHRFPEPRELSSLRLVVEQTHDAPEARVFEIRAY